MIAGIAIGKSRTTPRLADRESLSTEKPAAFGCPIVAALPEFYTVTPKGIAALR
jgi:hypothetical protein